MRLIRPGDGDGLWCCWSIPEPGNGSAIDNEHGPIGGLLGAWYGRVLLGSLSANIFLADCGLAAPNFGLFNLRPSLVALVELVVLAVDNVGLGWRLRTW